MSFPGPQGGASFVDYVNLAAGVYWPIFIVMALRSAKINFGALAPKITRAEQPGLYWSILAFLAFITLVLWLLVAARFLPGLQG